MIIAFDEFFLFKTAFNAPSRGENFARICSHVVGFSLRKSELVVLLVGWRGGCPPSTELYGTRTVRVVVSRTVPALVLSRYPFVPYSTIPVLAFQIIRVVPDWR